MDRVKPGTIFTEQSKFEAFIKNPNTSISDIGLYKSNLFEFQQLISAQLEICGMITTQKVANQEKAEAIMAAQANALPKAEVEKLPAKLPGAKTPKGKKK